MINRPEEISFHAAVDDKEIIQAIPFDRNAWASGDGHGVGNMEGIHIEICYSLSGGPRFEKAERNAAEYIASLLKRYGWGMAQVTKHQDYDGKYCPHRTLDLGWGRFLKMVENFLKEDDKMLSYEEFKAYQDRYEEEKAKKAAGGWAEPALAYCEESGIMVGDKGGGMRPQSNITRQEAAQMFYSCFCRYKTIDDIPSRGKDTVQRMIDLGVVAGYGKDEQGRVILNMSEIELRGLCWLERYVGSVATGF